MSRSFKFAALVVCVISIFCINAQSLIRLTSQVTGILPLANGGTGAGSLAAAGIAASNATLTLNGATATLGASSQVPVYGPCSEGIAQFSTTDTLTNGGTGEQVFATKCTIAANYFTANRAIRVTLTLDIVAATTVPNSTFRAKLCTVSGCASGTVVNGYISTTTPFSNSASTTQAGMTFIIQGTAAAGSSVGLEFGAVAPSRANTSNAATYSNTQVTRITGVPTNGTLYLQFSNQFSGTGSNNPTTLSQLIVEGLN